MEEGCLRCKNYESCDVIKNLIAWQEKQHLEVEETEATWMIDHMTCSLFVVDTSLPEYQMQQIDGLRSRQPD